MATIRAPKPSGNVVKKLLAKGSMSNWIDDTELVDLYIKWARGLNLDMHNRRNQDLFKEHMEIWIAKHKCKWVPAVRN